MIAEQETMCALIISAAEAGALRKLVFSQPFEKETAPRQTGRLCLHRGERILLIEEQYEGGRVAQKLVRLSDVAEELTARLPLYRSVNLLTAAGDAELRVNKKGHAHLQGGERLGAKLSSDEPRFATAVNILPLMREKNRILRGDEPFLKALGVSDANGRIHDKRQAKFRQIDRFLEHLSDLYPSLPGDKDLLIYDLCCGKSYLSFAVYHYLHELCGRRVRMICIDLKRDVIDYCVDVARRAGFDGMEFICGDVRRAVPAQQPDLVISLHACDIATDIVLEQAIALKAGAILATPCCHRYLSDRIQCPDLAFVTDHPQLRNKLAEALTDGLRLLRLEEAGYAVTAMELTDPDDTPKNTLLRAVRRRPSAKTDAAREAAALRYRAALAFLLGENTDRFPETI